MENNLAPVIVFAYKRADLLEQTLLSLAQNPESENSEGFIFCDGPKSNASAIDLAEIEKVRKVARSRNWFSSTKVIESGTNKGLARSVTEGVSEILKDHSSVIVVEDDVQLSPHFLRFMNDGLQLYSENEKVMAVGSWNYFADGKISDSSFFLRYPDSIAWATWRRSWLKFRTSGEQVFQEIQQKNLMQRFNGDSQVAYFSNMLQQQCSGKIDSWAIRWTATAIVEDMYTLYPAKSMSRHVGFGEGATHETQSKDYNETLGLSDKPMVLKALTVSENKTAFACWRSFLRKNFADTNGFSGWKLWVWQRMPISFRNWYRAKTVHQ